MRELKLPRDMLIYWKIDELMDFTSIVGRGDTGKHRDSRILPVWLGEALLVSIEIQGFYQYSWDKKTYRQNEKIKDFTRNRKVFCTRKMGNLVILPVSAGIGILVKARILVNSIL